MTLQAAIDVDVIYHNSDASTFVIGAASDHLRPDVANALTITGAVGTALVSIPGTGPLATLAIKNTGSNPLRIAGAFNVSAGRVAVLPTTATVTVSAPSGDTQYTAVWIG